MFRDLNSKIYVVYHRLDGGRGKAGPLKPGDSNILKLG